MSKLCAGKSEPAPCQTENLQIIATNKGKKSENSVVKRSRVLASYLLQTVQLTQQLCANKKLHTCYNKDFAIDM